MKKIELEINRYSTKKLKEIIQEQSNAYSERFIDFAKNELIRRGETFDYDVNLEKKVGELTDDELKNLVEKEREDYNLEYLELCIREYIKRGFKNETGYDDTFKVDPETDVTEHYPTLRIYSGLYILVGILNFVFAIYIAFIDFQRDYKVFKIPLIIFFILTGIAMLAASEAIKVFLAIEKNTRNTMEN